MRHPALVRVTERVILRLVDHVIIVVEESRERLRQAGVPNERITVVSNTPRLNGRSPPGSTRLAIGGKNGLRLVYLGNVDGSRGIDLVLRALGSPSTLEYATELVVVGDGPNLSHSCAA